MHVLQTEQCPDRESFDSIIEQTIACHDCQFIAAKMPEYFFATQVERDFMLLKVRNIVSATTLQARDVLTQSWHSPN